jgi:hypothetical protein
VMQALFSYPEPEKGEKFPLQALPNA